MLAPTCRYELDLQKIRQSLDADYSLRNIHKKYGRKHMTYIFCQMNNLPPPYIPPSLIAQLHITIRNMIENSKKRNAPNYINIIRRICQMRGYHDILPYLYIKKCNEELDDFIDKYI